ncbi:hypothetical protein JST97_24490 [bacterium]|nr:hypothetical protein [bacterium]
MKKTLLAIVLLTGSVWAAPEGNVYHTIADPTWHVSKIGTRWVIEDSRGFFVGYYVPLPAPQVAASPKPVAPTPPTASTTNNASSSGGSYYNSAAYRNYNNGYGNNGFYGNYGYGNYGYGYGSPYHYNPNCQNIPPAPPAPKPDPNAGRGRAMVPTN